MLTTDQNSLNYGVNFDFLPVGKTINKSSSPWIPAHIEDIHYRILSDDTYPLRRYGTSHDTVCLECRPSAPLCHQHDICQDGYKLLRLLEMFMCMNLLLFTVTSRNITDNINLSSSSSFLQFNNSFLFTHVTIHRVSVRPISVLPQQLVSTEMKENISDVIWMWTEPSLFFLTPLSGTVQPTSNSCHLQHLVSLMPPFERSYPLLHFPQPPDSYLQVQTLKWFKKQKPPNDLDVHLFR